MPKQDNISSAEITVSADRSSILNQRAFGQIYATGSLVGDALYKAAITTPAASTGKIVHLRPARFSATANTMTLSIYEDSTFTSGTSVVLYNHKRGENPAVASTTLKTGVTAALTGKNITAATAGGNFGNQPAGDGVEAVSDNAADVGMTLTIYGTKTGATATVTSETITMNGVTQAATVLQTWQNILGAELSAVCAGTVTIREASGNATVTTIAAGNLTAGIVTITDSRGRDQILKAIGSGAATTPVGAIGTDPTGAAVSSVIALNGATAVSLNSDVFRTVTKLLNGAVASTVNVTFSRPEVLLDSITVGAGGNSQNRGIGAQGADDEWILEPGTSYVISVLNGATTASIGTVNLLLIEETY